MAPQPSFAAVCRELDSRRHVTLGLERIRKLLSLLGNPERDARIVQVVGTNGKGTTAVALAAALEAAGHPAGAYLSPHVLSYTERVMLRGRPVTEETFASAMGGVIETSDEDGVEASQFELLTAGALKMFRDAGLRWVVLEAGLGARHDATTAAGSEAVVLTNVGLDHTEYLGETVEEITREKVAGVRPGGLLVLGTRDPVVVEVARRECARLGAGLVEAVDGTQGPPVPTLARLAPYAARDARLGIRAAETVLGRVLAPEVWERAARGVEGVLPGRFEAHEVRGVPVVVDGAHNVAGLEAALAAVEDAYGDRPLGVVFGSLRDKDIASMLVVVKEAAHALVLTRPENGRAAEPAWIAEEYVPRDREGRKARVIDDAGDALGVAVEEMRRVGGVVLVTGSLYTGSRVLGWLREG